MTSVIEQSIRTALAPPSDLPEWRWAQENIIVVEGAMTGRYSVELTPMIRAVSEAAQDRRVRRIVLMVSAQSAKTRWLMNKLCHFIVEDPGPTMWVMANGDHVREFHQKRLLPALEACGKVRELLPQTRELNKRGLILFDSMPFTLRGSNSRAKLQSDPVRYIICDERREWSPGAIDLLRKRQRTFHNSLELSAGTPGTKADELHADFLAGTQTHFHFRCLKCQHSQPFRFGKDKSVMFPKPRKKGGLRWDTNDVTKPNGEWDEDALRKTVRYECESCDATFVDSDKLALLKSLHPVVYNPHAPSGMLSFTWNAMAMLWPDCRWTEIVIEFIRAERAMRHGNIEPLKSCMTETFSEPWEERGQKAEANELRQRCGAVNGEPYERGQKWVQGRDEDIGTVLSCDVQGMGAGFIKWVSRQFRRNGNSRLLDYGLVHGFEDLRHVQQKLGVPNDLVFIDSGFHAQDVYRACLSFGWMPLKSVESEYFVHYVDGIPRQIPWRKTRVDPSLGKTGGGRIEIEMLLWSSKTYLNRLLLYIAKGRGPRWLLPDDIGEEYIHELMAREKRESVNKRGLTVSEWVKVAADDWLICEAQCLVVGDAGGLATAGEDK
jgi:hypothetical protein